MKTDNLAYQTTQELRNINSDSILCSGGAYDKAGYVFIENYCAPQGNYEFVIYDSYWDGLCPTWSSICGYYEVRVNDISVVSGAAFSKEQMKEFTLSETDDQYFDGNPCTFDSYCEIA